ncbi:nucleotidyltransferase family protein [Catalinimonas niigatensis]|uniref:nucleotidyltransferase family protein n=1 Tax=Catalinimonas niigatensis TaxID=1397264 RepID=UPI0026663CC7|nr:nucleotidyltransferase family protein [Catalinimonas niigatensis]WPP48606.1 nucleotidyltransferase family protein [Catalinimonas niigatensis]
MSESEKHAIIILAAGESSRMGEPKQLLQLDGKSLLRHAVEEAVGADIGPVIVVLGAFSDQIVQELHGLPIVKVINSDWQQGMGTSIRKGVLEVQKNHNTCQGAVIMLSDQPFANANLLKKLLKIFYSSKKPIVASAYKGILGVPAYFHHLCFVSLTQLEGPIGARKFIQQHAKEVEAVPFPLGAVDIDTPEDYARLKEKIKGK